MYFQSMLEADNTDVFVILMDYHVQIPSSNYPPYYIRLSLTKCLLWLTSPHLWSVLERFSRFINAKPAQSVTEIHNCFVCQGIPD
jgi:hypothetical protein